MSKAKTEAVKNTIKTFCERNGLEVGSHYYKGRFIVSHPVADGMLGPNSRKWYVAQVSSVRGAAGKFESRVDLVSTAQDLINGARSDLNAYLAEQGISPRKAKPDAELHGLPCYPCTVLNPF